MQGYPACGRGGIVFWWNPESWDLESEIQLRNPDPANDWNESRIQVLLAKDPVQEPIGSCPDPVLGIRNPLRGIQNPRPLGHLAWVVASEALFLFNRL